MYVCVVPLREGTGPIPICWSGRSSAAGAGCPDVPSSSPAVPTAQLPRPRLSFLGRGEGTPLRLSLCSLQTKWGGEVVMFWFGVGDLGQN